MTFGESDDILSFWGTPNELCAFTPFNECHQGFKSSHPLPQENSPVTAVCPLTGARVKVAAGLDAYWPMISVTGEWLRSCKLWSDGLLEFRYFRDLSSMFFGFYMFQPNFFGWWTHLTHMFGIGWTPQNQTRLGRDTPTRRSVVAGNPGTCYVCLHKLDTDFANVMLAQHRSH